MKTETTYGEHVTNKAESNLESKHRQRVRKGLKYANQKLVYGNHEDAARAVRTLDRLLLGERTASQLALFHRRRGLPELDVQSVVAVREGGATDEQVETAVQSLEAVAVDQDIIDDELRNYAPAYGFSSMRIGRLYKSPRYSQDSVQICSYHAGETKTLYHGETGEGKSTAMSGELADRWAANCLGEWHDGRHTREESFKILDVIDTDVCENAVYEIPQQQEPLREARTEMGLPPDYEGVEGFDRPNHEILVPLTRELAGEEFPTNDDGDSPIEVFTIPAADLTKRALTHFLGGTTEQQQSIIGMAYDRVSESRGDWTLEDLAVELMQVDGASESFKERAVNEIIELQRAGFIRDQSCPHSIDWREIFEDTETITSFTQSFLDDADQKLMVLAYLLYSLYWEREGLDDLPRCVVVGRELHEIAPHSQENVGTDREQALRSAIIGELGYTFRKNRKQDMEFVFDTQDITDIKRGVRKRFNRAVTFQTHEDALEELFGKVAGNVSEYRDHRHAVSTTTVGQGTVIGKTVPNDRRDTVFLANLQFAPPPWHVFDDDEFDSGLHERVAYLDEKWQPHDIDCSLPDRLTFEMDDIHEAAEADGADGDDALSYEERKAMHKQEARRRRRAGESIRQVRSSIPPNPRTGKPYSVQTVQKWTEDVPTNEPNTKAK